MILSAGTTYIYIKFSWCRICSGKKFKTTTTFQKLRSKLQQQHQNTHAHWTKKTDIKKCSAHTNCLCYVHLKQWRGAQHQPTTTNYEEKRQRQLWLNKNVTFIHILFFLLLFNERQFFAPGIFSAVLYESVNMNSITSPNEKKKEFICIQKKLHIEIWVASASNIIVNRNLNKKKIMSERKRNL